MRKLAWILVMATVCLSKSASSQDQPRANPHPDALAYREPFTLKLRVDKDHYYEEPYDKRIPYVAESDVYLFSGENFGVNLSIKGDDISEVIYQPDAKKADVWFSFKQAKELRGIGMILIIQNKLRRTLYMDAVMTVPGKKEILKTSIVPINAGLSDFESWPHPIVQLIIRNIRFFSKTPQRPQ